MKLAIWLRNIFGLGYYLTIIIFMVVFGLMIFAIVADYEIVREFVSRSKNLTVKTKPALFAALSFTLISGAFWIYILRLLRNLTFNLSNRDLFSKYQISTFKLSGQLIIVATVLDYITKFIFEALFNGKLKSFDLFDFILAIGIGLFLILLSQVFQKAKNLKDENELTV